MMMTVIDQDQGPLPASLSLIMKNTIICKGVEAQPIEARELRYEQGFASNLKVTTYRED